MSVRCMINGQVYVGRRFQAKTVCIEDGKIRLLPPGTHVVTRSFQHISLFALELSCISLESMQYPLDHRMVDEADIYTLSNEVAENEEKGIIHVHSGRLLLVQSNLP